MYLTYMHHHIALKWPCLPPASLLASSRTCRHSWVPVDAERALRQCVEPDPQAVLATRVHLPGLVEPEVVTGEHHRVRLVVRVQDHVRPRNFEPILISG